MTPYAGMSQEALPPRILIVEDEVLIRMFLGEALRDEGAIVIEAATAEEAWSFIEAGGHVDLVISDLHMPGSMDGVELARRIQRLGSGLPVILTSGNPGPTDYTGLGRLLPKPYAFEQLFALIGTLLNASS